MSQGCKGGIEGKNTQRRDRGETSNKSFLVPPKKVPKMGVSPVSDNMGERMPYPQQSRQLEISELLRGSVSSCSILHWDEEWLFQKVCKHSAKIDSPVLCINVIACSLLQCYDTTENNPYCLNSLLYFHADDPIRCQHTSSPLGNGAVVETSDKRILVLQRSNNVGEFPGHFVFPGGHPEPQEIGILSHQYDKDMTYTGDINRKVSQEMFDGIIREVVEEIGVPAASLCDPVFIGISRRELNVRPTAFFFLKCSLESKEIQQLYASAQDGYESTQLYAVSRVELENMTSKMPGCHRGGFALYELMVDTVNDV
ncbi:hypothetical protein HHK36_010909 [Tetracentron sinense]|uniref:Nudix hydrolase domain-containing protein n=1 Tax=Tetracentron sinense TaxID=13715 RepID=A0A834ZCP4_TETSI|nr:hypothetical protein HHK36_010909 [Tetracentron sinense]